MARMHSAHQTTSVCGLFYYCSSIITYLQQRDTALQRCLEAKTKMHENESLIRENFALINIIGSEQGCRIWPLLILLLLLLLLFLPLYVLLLCLCYATSVNLNRLSICYTHC
jgi:hypothetical protein